MVIIQLNFFTGYQLLGYHIIYIVTIFQLYYLNYSLIYIHSHLKACRNLNTGIPLRYNIIIYTYTLYTCAKRVADIH